MNRALPLTALATAALVTGVLACAPTRLQTVGLPTVERAATAQPTLTESQAIERGNAHVAARRFREAIATYTDGIAATPTSSMLYRWRGHRRISIRDLGGAQIDLESSVGLDTLNYGALFHLGVVHFINGHFRNAVVFFSRAVPVAPNPGERAGSRDWLWMSLMRAGDTDSAAVVIRTLPDSVAPDYPYLRRLRLYRGEIAPEALIGAQDTVGTARATLAYGLGNWYFLRGDTARAFAAFREAIRDTSGRPAFGYIAAESELAGRTPHEERLDRYTAAARCLDAAPPDAFVRRNISLAATTAQPVGIPAGGPAAAALRTELDSLLARTAARLRRDLSLAFASVDSLAAPVDAQLDWRDINTALFVTLRSDDGPRLYHRPRSPQDRASVHAGAEAIRRALEAVLRDPATRFRWPDGTAKALWSMSLGFTASPVSVATDVARPGAVVFSAPTPIPQGARVLRSAMPRYPASERASGMEASVRFQFVIDTMGRVDTSTVRESWPVGTPRQVGERGERYRRFVDAARAVLPSLQFAPATMAGCRVPTTVQQSFEFRLAP